jgi:PTS system nitrogen regulatory IIA component
MELRVREVAKLLNVSEQTVYRWARDGSLPAHRVGDQYRFNRVELQEWAATHGRSVSPRLFTPQGSAEPLPSLRAALERGGVYPDVAGRSREEILGAVARLPGVPAGVDRAMLEQLLIGREALASTAIGDGIALPHPRDPLVVRVDEPRILLCFLREPVDFGAMDGVPVRILFTLLSPSVRQHLQTLAKLAFALHDPALRDLLNRAAPQEEILGRIQTLEQTAGPAAAAPDEPSSHPPAP